MVMLTQLPEGSSSSDRRYDVFLSFRGEDTRHGFTDHLHEALLVANIDTFLDEEDLQIGEDLKPELETAIKASRASIIVLSKNYASSTRCLDQLVLILEQHRTSQHIVIPIFYHVEPTDVRKQQSSFGDALMRHTQSIEAETNMKKRSQRAQKMEQWKKALTEVAGLKGKDANGRRETRFIDEIVMDIHRRLGVQLPRDLPRLVGIDYSIEFITSWLKDGSSHTVDILTIWGMGGIGKTSLAKYVHGSHCREFEGTSFIEDIGRRCADHSRGLLDLKKHLFDDISKSNSSQFHDAYVNTYKIEDLLPGKKLFIVLDGIDSFEQLNVLLGTKGLHPGSKIIITTKDGSLTEKCALFNQIVRPIHTKHLLEGLYEAASLQLLCCHAFMCNEPLEGYEEVCKKFVNYCGGHPLALEVLGRSLRNREMAEWEDYLQVLENETNPHIQNVLQVSFDSLPSKNDKELFKNISCFFVGKDKDFTETILKACGINTLRGITNLIDRCLLRIGPRNELMMHQLLQEMGRDVVHQESPMKPWKRSRLWRHEESFNVLKKKKGTGNLQGLILDMKMPMKSKLHGSLELKTDAFSKMNNLMLLQLNHVQLEGCYKNLPKELRWLCMHGFPLDNIPSDLPMENLVALDLSYSSFQALDMSYDNSQRLGKRRKLIGSCSKRKGLLGSLKILNLSFCGQLCSLSGFSQLPALERLMLTGCGSLIQVCESVGQCEELVLIDLCYCSMLEKLPESIGKLKKVRTLLLDGCFESPIKMESQASPYAVANILTPSPKSFFHSLPASLVTISLKNNNLVNESFPMYFSSLSMLKNLHLDENLIVSVPDCVRRLVRLELLTLNCCYMLKTVEHPPGMLRELQLDGCISLLKIAFVPQMSTPTLPTTLYEASESLNEIEGIFKIQPIAHVEEEVLQSLGWTNLEFVKNQEVEAWYSMKVLGPKLPVQMYYEFGIFSTFFWGKEVPKWISYRSKGSSISFTMPSSTNNLRGLNLYSVHTGSTIVPLPGIKISNLTKKLTWIYFHYVDWVRIIDEGVVWLSHWMFGKEELEDGDQVSVTIEKDEIYNDVDVTTLECGIGLVYDDGNMREDPLNYYKSWSHIIGGNLSGFQLTSGEYLLTNLRFFNHYSAVSEPYYHPLVGKDAHYKEKQVYFCAFSERNLGLLQPA